MRLVVTDASSLIDLRKGDPLKVLFCLPFSWIVPLPVREFEILDFSEHDWHQLIGDKLLRRVARCRGLEVHGVLWLIDQLVDTRRCPKQLVVSALETWQKDKSVFLPPDTIERRLNRMK